MRSRSKGHALVGGVSSALGSMGVAAGLFRPAFLSGAVLETPLWAIFAAGGSVLVLCGVFVMISTFRPAPVAAGVVPAHVAFNSRMTVEPMAPPSVAARLAGEASGRFAMAPSQGQGRVAPRRVDLASMDAQIRDLTRQINKAGVMLATGQLSQQGYLAYVEDMKAKRGQLEAERVRAELQA